MDLELSKFEEITKKWDTKMAGFRDVCSRVPVFRVTSMTELSFLQASYFISCDSVGFDGKLLIGHSVVVG